MNEDALAKRLSKIIKEAKEKSGHTLSYIAEKMNRNEKTIANWISGKATPTVPALFTLFEILEQPVFKALIAMMYPGVFEGDSIGHKRAVLTEYTEKYATDEQIEKMFYIVFGEHGSSWSSQLEEFTALDNLPMKDRVCIAYIISHCYELAEAKNELSNRDVLPNIERFIDGISRGREATINGLDFYHK